MAEPKDITELRWLLGMVYYLGRFVPNLATYVKPFNDLLHKDAAWTWDLKQKQAFQAVKDCLSSAPTLAYFELGRKTVIASDASSYGLGAVLYQVHDGELKPIAYSSRTLMIAGQKYAQIEKDCLGVVFACETFERYLAGLPCVKVLTDHKPLIPVLMKRDLADTPVRCQRMRMWLMCLNIVADFIAGKDLTVADALSRSLGIDDSFSYEKELEADTSMHVGTVRMSWSASDAKFDKLRKATAEDITLSMALEYTCSGWPQYKHDVKLAARELYCVKDDLSEFDGRLVRGNRIVIPHSLRKDILSRIHDGHKGIVKCRERANKCVWWPCMGKEIKDMISSSSSSSSSAFTAISLRFTSWVRFLRKWPFSNPTIEVVTFRLRGWIWF